MNLLELTEIELWKKEHRKAWARLQGKPTKPKAQPGAVVLVEAPPIAPVRPKAKLGRPKEGQFRGVSPTKTGFKAQIHVKGRTVSLGTYRTQESAARAFDARAFALRGFSEDLNFPDEWRGVA